MANHFLPEGSRAGSAIRWDSCGHPVSRSRFQGVSMTYIITLNGKEYFSNNLEQAQLIQQALRLIGEEAKIVTR